MEGHVYDIIIEGPSRTDETMWFGRTSGNKMVLFPREDRLHVGDTVQARITKGQTWVLYGEIL